MKQILLLLFIVLLTLGSTAQGSNSVAKYDVAWHCVGTDENSSMPLGNGDIALNIWTEQNGDIVLLIAKSDAWSENGQLLKLGKVRVSLTPNPFTNTKSFTQTLRLEIGEVELFAGKNSVRIWFNSSSLYPLVFEREHLESLLPKYPDPLLHRCFGITMKGEHLLSLLHK
jgi:alpha-L-fucosidase 2